MPVKMCLSRLPLRCLKLSFGHITIIGRTGSGKTNTVKVILEEIVKRKAGNILVLDWAGEYKGLKEYKPGINFKINIAGEPATYDPDYAYFLADVFSSVLNLSDPQAYLLYKTLKKLRPPFRLAEIVSAVENAEVRSYKDLDVKAALLRRLEPLNDGILGKALNGSQDPYAIFKEKAIVKLNTIPSLRGRTLLALIILRNLYDYMYSNEKSDEIHHFTVLEEAWNIVPYRRREEPPSIGERLFLEIRKYGECLIAISQSLGDISERIIRNSSLILLHSSLPGETRYLGLMGIEGDLLPKRVGEALAITSDGKVGKIKIRKASRM